METDNKQAVVESTPLPLECQNCIYFKIERLLIGLLDANIEVNQKVLDEYQKLKQKEKGSENGTKPIQQ